METDSQLLLEQFDRKISGIEVGSIACRVTIFHPERKDASPILAGRRHPTEYETILANFASVEAAHEWVSDNTKRLCRDATGFLLTPVEEDIKDRRIAECREAILGGGIVHVSLFDGEIFNLGRLQSD